MTRRGVSYVCIACDGEGYFGHFACQPCAKTGSVDAEEWLRQAAISPRGQWGPNAQGHKGSK